VTQEQKEYVVLRTLFVVFCTLIGAAIGIWFSWQVAVGLGLFQFVLCMGFDSQANRDARTLSI